MRKTGVLTICLLLIIGVVSAMGCTQDTVPAEPGESGFVGEPIRWTAQTQTTAGDPQNDAMRAQVDLMNQASGGRLEITLHDGGAIVPMGEELDGVMDGSLDFAMTTYAFHVGHHRACEIFGTTPGGLTPTQNLTWHRQGGGHELATRLYEQEIGQGLKYIGNNMILTSEIWAHSNVPLESMDDISGLKMRCAGAAGEVLTELGASVVFVPGGEIYEAAQRGVIDAFEYDSATPNWKMGFQEVADYLYIGWTRAPAACGFTVTTQDNWAELPDDLKVLIREIGTSQAVDYLSYLIEQDAVHIQKFRDYGTIVDEIPDEIADAVIEEGKAYLAKQSAADPFYGETVDSMLAWKEACMLAGIS